MTNIDLLLFDLGGVLVEFSGLDGLRALVRVPLDRTTIHERLAASSLLRQFETGAVEPAEFADRFVREWDLTISPDEFISKFRGWSRVLLPGARELLA